MSEINRIPCKWSNGCPILLDDVSPAGIGRHLRDFHFVKSSDSKAMAVCHWDDCRREPMTQGAMGKHIASVHLKATQVICPACGRSLARNDTLLRHRAEVCQS